MLKITKLKCVLVTLNVTSDRKHNKKSNNILHGLYISHREDHIDQSI